MKRSGAYKLEVGDVFITGHSTDVDYCRVRHVTLLRRGEHPNARLQAAWNGSASSTVLRHVDPLETDTEKSFLRRLAAAERELIDCWADSPRFAGSAGAGKRVDVRARWRDPAFRKRMLEKMKPVGADTRAKMSGAKKGSLNPRSRPVRVTWPDGRVEVFPSCTEAGADLGVSQQLVHLWASGKAAQPGSGVRACRKPHLAGVVVGYEG